MKLLFGIQRRWFQISMRTLLLVVLVLCAWLALWTGRARRQAEAVRRLVDAGAAVHYRHEFDAAGNRIADPVLPGPQWLRNIFGNQAFWQVYSVEPASAVGLRDDDLKPLAQLGTIERVRLSDKTTDAGLANLSGLSNLKSLQIQSLNITNHGLSYLSNLQNLEMLSVEYAQVDDEGLKHLTSLHNLNYVGLVHTWVTAEGVAWLKERLPLAYIDARFPSHDEEKEIVRHLFKLGARIGVDSDGWVSAVELWGHEVTDDAILVADQLQHLAGVRIRNASISPSAIKRLREHHPNVKFDPPYPENVLDDADAIAALQGLDGRIDFDREGYVQRVGISSEQVSDDELAPLAKLSRVKQIIIDSAGVTDAGLKHLRRLTTLNVLHLPKSELTDAGLTNLVELANLQKLSLRGPAITDAGLAQLAKLPGLTSLVLHDVHIGGPGLKHLRSLPALSSLSLAGRQSAIRDEGLQYLSELPALRSLNLYSAPISDKGLVHLAKLQSLETLSLSNTSVTDAGLVHLESLNHLKSLHLENTAVTKEGVQRFLSHVPQCKVTY